MKAFPVRNIPKVIHFPPRKTTTTNTLCHGRFQGEAVKKTPIPYQVLKLRNTSTSTTTTVTTTATTTTTTTTTLGHEGFQGKVLTKTPDLYEVLKIRNTTNSTTTTNYQSYVLWSLVLHSFDLHKLDDL